MSKLKLSTDPIVVNVTTTTTFHIERHRESSILGGYFYTVDQFWECECPLGESVHLRTERSVCADCSKEESDAADANLESVLLSKNVIWKIRVSLFNKFVQLLGNVSKDKALVNLAVDIAKGGVIQQHTNSVKIAFVTYCAILGNVDAFLALVATE